MEKSQLLCFVTLGIYAAAVLFFLCGFGGPNWVEYSESFLDANAGLWKQCYNDDCSTIKLTNSDNPDWYKATASLMILAFVGMVASGVTFLWLPITALCHCVTGGLTMLAIIVYGAKFEDNYDGWDLGWSFGLATLSAILFLVNGGLMAFMALSSSCDMSRRAIPCIESPRNTV